LIELVSVTKKFGSFTALSNLNLTVPKGGLYSFLGPNGAGKTTTIKILTGILHPDSGDALIDGISIIKNPVEAKKKIGYLPDIPSLFEKLTGAEYLNFIMDIYGIPKSERESRTKKYLQAFELEPNVNSLIETYSLGMKKKIGIIAALCHAPSFILLDEPTSGLDPQSVRLFKDILKEQAAAGATIFFSTHILEIAEKICDRVAIISKGRIVAEGTVAGIRSKIDDTNADTKTLEDIFIELTAANGDSKEIIKAI